MQEYWITINVQVDAEDDEQALAIARAIINDAKEHCEYKFEAQIETVEEA